MCVVFRGIFRKKFSNFAFDVVTLVSGLEGAEAFFRRLIHSLQTILLLESDAMKLIAIDLLIILVTATDNINQNTLMEYLIHMEIFDTLLQVASKATTDVVLSFNAIVVLTLLANYQKYEISNPYLKRIRDIEDDAVFLVRKWERPNESGCCGRSEFSICSFLLRLSSSRLLVRFCPAPAKTYWRAYSSKSTSVIMEKRSYQQKWFVSVVFFRNPAVPFLIFDISWRSLTPNKMPVFGLLALFRVYSQNKIRRSLLVKKEILSFLNRRGLSRLHFTNFWSRWS
jgi:hypothetical protein